MERRTAIAVSAAVGATLLASGAAFAANVGLLSESDDPVGRLEPTSVGTQLLGEQTPTTPQTLIVDVPVGPDGSVSDDGTVDQGPGDNGTNPVAGDDDGTIDQGPGDAGFDDDDAFDDDGSDDAFDDHGGTSGHDDDAFDDSGSGHDDDD